MSHDEAVRAEAEVTELTIRFQTSAGKYVVVQRPRDATESSKEIRLYTAGNKREAIAWAEGRQSLSGQPIRMS